jgi:membrane-bound serine protease (ClpP class)
MPMPRSRLKYRRLAVLIALCFAPRLDLHAQQPATTAGVQPGQFFAVAEPIDHATIESLSAAIRPYIQRLATTGHSPVLIFEFLPGDSPATRTSFGAATDLAEFLTKDVSGAKKTVAYVPESLSGYAVLGVLACDEIVLGPRASLGPIAPDGEDVSPSKKAVVRELATRKGRDPNLLLGMLERNADLREVKTSDRQTHYVFAADLLEFQRTHEVLESQPAWEGGRRGILTAERARQGFARLLAENRSQVAEVYRISSASDDPTLGGPINPVRIRIEGALGANNEAYLLRKISEAQNEKVNLIFFEIDSEGGLDGPANKVAERIARLKGIKTVAFIDNRALGVSSLVALACDDIVFRKGARLGDITRTVAERSGGSADLDPRTAEILADRASELARQKGHPAAVARAMVDRDAVVQLARDTQTGAVTFILEAQKQADPTRYEILETLHSAGDVLTLTDETARRMGISERVVKDFGELQTVYGLRGRSIRRDGPTWVDTLVFTLNTPFMKGLLLFIGFFMLVLELKLPGIGLPAITSALAFLLYFWSSYLGGTADQLEILLFLVGIVCLALELFVFPGLGVFGMSGVLLILVSVVMASHTFVWPTQDYEYRQLGQTLLQVTIAIVGVIACAAVFGRYFPSMPFFNRMVLRVEPAAETDPKRGEPLAEPATSYFFLLGETGRTSTVLKPTGKARFGELLLDVSAERSYIEADRLVEVVDVIGSRVVVREV